MPSHKLIATLLAFLAVVDLVLAFWIVGPRIPEASRAAFRQAMLAGSVVMLVLATAFWFGIVGQSS